MAKILVIEDRFEQQRLYQLLGQRFGVQMVVVDCCNDAVKAAENSDFDLIIVDWVLPGENGFACAQQIKAILDQRGAKTPPFVCVTARALKGDREECLNEGFDDYLSKPFTITQIYQLLRKWIPVKDVPYAANS